MPLVETLDVLRNIRRDDEIVLTVMGTAREWMALGDPHPLDWIYVPSSMGQAPSLGLGMALARPQAGVIVCNGDGCMLMNLGSLVTITQQAPKNYCLIIFDNGVYEVTGAQPTPATGPDGDRVDYPAIARGCGFTRVHAFDDLEAWRAAARELLDDDGPTFIHLSIEPVPDAVGPRSPGPAPDRSRAFAEAFESIGS